MAVPKILIALALVALGYLLALRAVPWLFVRLGRLLGFKMRLTPLTERRVQRFRKIRRGYWSFVAVVTAFVMSLFLELYVNNKPLYIRWGDHRAYPALAEWLDAWLPFVRLKRHARAVEKDFGLEGEGEVPYREYARWVADPEALERKARSVEQEIVEDERRFRAKLARDAQDRGLVYDPGEALPESKLAQYEEMRQQAARYRGLKAEFAAGKASILMPLHPYGPREQLLDLPGSPPHRPFSGQEDIPVMGTDAEGKEVLAQLLYGFRVSFSFALAVALVGFGIGITIGALMGYFGGWVDIAVQRVIEVWGSIPFLFTLMIVGSIYTPSFLVLALLLVVLRAWLGITYYVRGEFYREKARDYVQAARALGARSPKIMARHIFPNALVPIVTFMPFAIVSYVGILVSLDYLGFGLPPGTPSWGQLLRQGSENIANHPQLIYWPVLAFAATLFCVVMVGEAVREAFDPKLYSRLR